MGKIMNFNEAVSSDVDEIAVATSFVQPRLVKGAEAEYLHALLTRPARKPTPAMKRAIETYKRLKAEPQSSQ